ncbi:MAG: sodium:calcium antiporter, partial [Halothece sp.]
PEEVVEEFDVIPEENSPKEWLTSAGLLLIGLIMVVFGSNWLVSGATAFATALGISELVIGLTIVALGTSLPELATSIAASLRGERDIAVGNVVGSNIFNILIVLGTAGLISPTGVEVSSAAINLDIPIMIAVAVACLPIFFSDNLITRGEGIFFWFYYIIYTLFLFLKSTEHATLPVFNTVMLWFVIPITALTLIILTVSAWRERASKANEKNTNSEVMSHHKSQK